MPTIAFPPSPESGQVYVFEGKTWQYNGVGWARQVAPSVRDSRSPRVQGWFETLVTTGARLRAEATVFVDAGITTAVPRPKNPQQVTYI